MRKKRPIDDPVFGPDPRIIKGIQDSIDHEMLVKIHEVIRGHTLEQGLGALSLSIINAILFTEYKGKEANPGTAIVFMASVCTMMMNELAHRVQIAQEGGEVSDDRRSLN